jgi:hypothetical protein
MEFIFLLTAKCFNITLRIVKSEIPFIAALCGYFAIFKVNFSQTKVPATN